MLVGIDFFVGFSVNLSVDFSVGFTIDFSTDFSTVEGDLGMRFLSEGDLILMRMCLSRFEAIASTTPAPISNGNGNAFAVHNPNKSATNTLNTFLSTRFM